MPVRGVKEAHGGPCPEVLENEYSVTELGAKLGFAHRIARFRAEFEVQKPLFKAVFRYNCLF